MKSVSEQVQELHDQADRLLIAEVERIARAIMTKNKRCASFCMGMGTATFYDKAGNPILEGRGPLPYPKYLYPFDKFVSEWDRCYRITGTPMKIVGPNGPLLTDW